MSVATLGLEDFPSSLHAWPNKSEMLWLLGNAALLDLPLAAVVGTRDVSAEGIARTKRITSILVQEGFCVVSGLAHGVDSIAHRTALDLGGFTIAVMGTPIEQCYPRENLALKEEIAEKGLVISQFAPASPVQRGNFPRRNALMAALSEITFVVEADIDSGTRHQVKAAVQMGKRVAFLASLAERNYPWVLSALKTGLGIIIQKPEDALTALRSLRQTAQPPHVAAPEELLFPTADIGVVDKPHEVPATLSRKLEELQAFEASEYREQATLEHPEFDFGLLPTSNLPREQVPPKSACPPDSTVPRAESEKPQAEQIPFWRYIWRLVFR